MSRYMRTRASRVSLARVETKSLLLRAAPSRLYSKKRRQAAPLTPEAEALDFANRKEHLLNSGRELYPLLGTTRVNGQPPAIRVPEFRAQWESKATHETPADTSYTIQGRVKTIRKSGKGLIFIDIVQDFTKLQIVVNRDKAGLSQEIFDSEHAFLRRGDIVSTTGRPWRTKSGELSLLADGTVKLMTPCLHPLPLNLTNATTRAHNRVVDLAANAHSRDVLRARSTVMAYIREFFGARGFMEVQTPMLADRASGATATPFTTRSRALGSDGKDVELALRIAPELWLKRLVVSGFDKVFEVGQCFRNEGIDATHNPEFTSCEFYQSFATLEDLMDITQQLLRGVVQRVRDTHGAETFPLDTETGTGSRLDKLAEDFAPNFKVLDFVPEIEKCTGVPLPTDLSDVPALLKYFTAAGLSEPTVEANGALTAPKLLDKLAGIYLEPQCQDQPTFIVNHPTEMAPLAKSAIVNGRSLSRRFELFIHGREYANAYEEENSPFAQARKFAVQLRDREELHDEESPLPDDSFVRALEWGLPPTGGWGLGIDRLVMLLTGATRIEQVLAFGGVKTVNYQ